MSTFCDGCMTAAYDNESANEHTEGEMEIKVNRRANGTIEVKYNGRSAMYFPKCDAFVSRIYGPKEEMLEAARKWVAANPAPSDSD